MEKSTKISLSLSDANFINWLIYRLYFLHGYARDSDVLIKLYHIGTNIEQLCSTFSDDDLDKIISKYFVDFYLDRDNSSAIGYTRQERDNLRNTIKQIVSDINKRNIPKEILLK